MNSFPFIEISGSPFQRGKQYGEKARELVSESVETYGRRMELQGVKRADIFNYIKPFEQLCSYFKEDHLEEIRGIATGANLSFEEVLLINIRTEIVAKAKREKDQRDVFKSDGCTGVLVLPKRSRTRKLIHAQNWDWLTSCKDTGIVIRVLPEGGIPFLTFTEAGGLARSGVNQSGLSITANYLESDRDFRNDGVPLPFIRRQVLEHQHLAFAIRDITTTPKSCSNNMIVAHKDGWGTNIECAPDESFAVDSEQGLIVHANHWISPIAKTKLIDTGLHNSPDSLYRQARVTESLKDKRLISKADIEEALFDEFGSPYSVCRPPTDDENGESFSTVAMIIIDPNEGSMNICKTPYEGRNFMKYSLFDAPEEI